MSNVNKQLIVNKPLPIYKAGIKKPIKNILKILLHLNIHLEEKLKLGDEFKIYLNVSHSSLIKSKFSFGIFLLDGTEICMHAFVPNTLN